MSIASFKDVSFSYDKEAILEDINFTIEKGDFVGIAGPNGAGKTTLLKLLLGILKPIKGEVDLMTNKISYLKQVTSNNDTMSLSSVEEVLSLAYKNHFLKKEQKSAIKEAMAMFDIVGLEKRQISELSGGQQQKVSLALAYLKNAELIVMDEPTAGLDSASQEKLLLLFTKLNQEGKTLVIVSHSHSHLSFAKKVFSIEGKHLKEDQHV